jgi:CRP-like cAMP-binding protein
MPGYEALKSAALLKGLSDDQLKKLWDAGDRKTVHAGDAIIREGDVESTMFVLLEGSVEVSQTLVLKMSDSAIAEKEKTLIRLEGSMRPCFGEMSLLEDSERSATVTGITDCDVFAIEREPFFRLITEDPEMGVAILRSIATVVSGRLRKANRDVLKLTTALSLAVSI